jgi:hypothetical protein
MGIDKIRLISESPVSEDFCNWVTEDQKHPTSESRLNVFPCQESIERHSSCRISTRKKLYTPAFFLQMNFAAFKGSEFKQILELNPNKLENGMEDLNNLVKLIFGPDCGDLKISRIDLNGDVEVPIDYFFRAVRVPFKRKATKYLESDSQSIQVHGNAGITGIQVGASPSLLRVYDKRQELKKRRKDVSSLPKILTRLEWELRHSKCPVRYLSELPELLDIEPFEKIELLDTPEFYDFDSDFKTAKNQIIYTKLIEDYGAHEAARILNKGRHFKRDFRPALIDNEKLKMEIQESYLLGVERFFNNQGADVRYLYA